MTEEHTDRETRIKQEVTLKNVPVIKAQACDL